MAFVDPYQRVGELETAVETLYKACEKLVCCAAIQKNTDTAVVRGAAFMGIVQAMAAVEDMELWPV